MHGDKKRCLAQQVQRFRARFVQSVGQSPNPHYYYPCRQTSSEVRLGTFCAFQQF